jgi:hypothetical protein
MWVRTKTKYISLVAVTITWFGSITRGTYKSYDVVPANIGQRNCDWGGPSLDNNYRTMSS